MRQNAHSVAMLGFACVTDVNPRALVPVSARLVRSLHDDSPAPAPYRCGAPVVKGRDTG